MRVAKQASYNSILYLPFTHPVIAVPAYRGPGNGPEPAMVLGLSSAAPLMRYTRASMLDVLNSEYVTTARAKGLAPRLVVIRHAFRNSLIPIITVVGLLLPELVGGAVITEQIFAWPGMGQLAVRAASDRDTALMMGIVLVVGLAVLLTNILVDVLYATVDPRIRLGRSAS